MGEIFGSFGADNSDTKVMTTTNAGWLAPALTVKGDQTTPELMNAHLFILQAKATASFARGMAANGRRSASTPSASRNERSRGRARAATVASVSFDPSSRSRLSSHDLYRFADDTLFCRIARALCDANCVPRKELYEAWEVARRARRRFRGGRVVDLACGHGLVAHLMLLLDETSPTALAVDAKLPPSASRVNDCLSSAWPRLRGRVELREAALGSVALEPGDVIVSCHACGSLTDEVLERAVSARARVAVLPCCQATGKSDLGGLAGWLDPALAIDVTRAAKLRAAGYWVHTQTIPAQITPKNRLLLAAP